MSRIIQFKRFGAAALANTIGANGEIIFDITNKALTVHDGVVAGGYPATSDTTARNLANAAFSRANTANVTAEAGFAKANSSTALAESGTVIAIYANNASQAALTQVSAAFTRANSANVLAQAAFNAANAANSILAQASFDKANSANVLAQAAFNAANTANAALAQASFNKANVANTTAEASYAWGNTINVSAQAAFSRANIANTTAEAAFSKANVSNTTAEAAFAKANIANTTAEAGFAKANAANVLTQSAYNQANSVYLPSATRLDVTNNGSSAYLFDQYTGDNATLYVTAGETVSFNLNVTGHPFLIRISSSSTLYNIGLTHVTTTGVVTTNATAQGQVTGTLYWKVPSILAGNTYVYQCQVHAGMVGNIVIGNPNQATIANTTAEAGFAKANVANTTAEAGFAKANVANTTAEAGFAKANAANVLAQSAFTQANTSAQTVPQNAQTANYILQLSDAGKHIYYTQSSNVILYVPTTSNVAFSNGTTIMIVSRTSSSANITVSPNTGVSMFLAGNTTSASRNVTTYGMASLIQVASNTWFINGTGVS
jgi:hypothetical protein